MLPKHNTHCQNTTDTSKDCAHAPWTVQVKMADEEEAIRYYFSRNYDYATILNFLERLKKHKNIKRDTNESSQAI